MNAPWCIEQW